MNTVYIGIGTNIDRHKHIEAGLRELEQLGGTSLHRLSMNVMRWALRASPFSILSPS
ncbi:hypothetical protein JCM19233_1404 [Vibrio astriarenae]|nr:hypothetical protein JCM19233_1404 [Vibrio sp. C7]